MPFEKGKITNKSGPKPGQQRKHKQLAELLMEEMSPREAVKKFVQNMREAPPDEYNYSFREYCDRAFGKAAQAVEVDHGGEIRVVIVDK